MTPLRARETAMERAPWWDGVSLGTVSALDQLVGCDILARSDDTYRLGREAMRAKLLEGLTSEELRSFHGARTHHASSLRCGHAIHR